MTCAKRSGGGDGDGDTDAADDADEGDGDGGGDDDCDDDSGCCPLAPLAEAMGASVERGRYRSGGWTAGRGAAAACSMGPGPLPGRHQRARR